MLLADGRAVPDLRLDPAVVERCRSLADRIAGDVLGRVRRTTTVSVERTVLRLLGFHDAGPRGVPLVNAMVDALHDRGLLARGAAYWMGYVMRRGARDPSQVVDRIASLPRSPEPLSPADRSLESPPRCRASQASSTPSERQSERNPKASKAMWILSGVRNFSGKSVTNNDHQWQLKFILDSGNKE